jgi:hypothetical protein
VNKTIKIKTLKFCLKKLEMSEKKNAFNMLMIPRREQSEYIKLRVLYRDALEGKIENNMEKIGFFENYVLPSLAKHCEVTVYCYSLLLTWHLSVSIYKSIMLGYVKINR